MRRSRARRRSAGERLGARLRRVAEREHRRGRRAARPPEASREHAAWRRIRVLRDPDEPQLPLAGRPRPANSAGTTGSHHRLTFSRVEAEVERERVRPALAEAGHQQRLVRRAPSTKTSHSPSALAKRGRNSYKSACSTPTRRAAEVDTFSPSNSPEGTILMHLSRTESFMARRRLPGVHPVGSRKCTPAVFSRKTVMVRHTTRISQADDGDGRPSAAPRRRVVFGAPASVLMDLIRVDAAGPRNRRFRAVERAAALLRCSARASRASYSVTRRSKEPHLGAARLREERRGAVGVRERTFSRVTWGDSIGRGSARRGRG